MAENDVTLNDNGKIVLDDPACLLARKPKKSILKMKHESQEGREGHARFDEMNILATYHPADKDYGTMKIDEPKTPYHHSDGESEPDEGSTSAVRGRRVSLGSAIDPEELAQGITNAHDKPLPLSDGSEDESNLTEEQKQKKLTFERKRKAHYNEGAALKAHLSMDAADEEDDDEEDESNKMES